MKLPKTRNYKFKSESKASEGTNFWIFIVIGLVIAAAILFLL
ncbi:hypothetical protein [Olivibacter sitiensis]|nr:hypothetical protein [Olivibacter sitiensis]